MYTNVPFQSVHHFLVAMLQSVQTCRVVVRVVVVGDDDDVVGDCGGEMKTQCEGADCYYYYYCCCSVVVDDATS